MILNNRLRSYCSGAEPITATDRTRSALADMRQMQIKTLSFLAYVMRQAHNIIRGHQVHLRGNADCPSMQTHQVAQCIGVLIAAPVETSLTSTQYAHEKALWCDRMASRRRWCAC